MPALRKIVMTTQVSHLQKNTHLQTGPNTLVFARKIVTALIFMTSPAVALGMRNFQLLILTSLYHLQHLKMMTRYSCSTLRFILKAHMMWWLKEIASVGQLRTQLTVRHRAAVLAQLRRLCLKWRLIQLSGKT